MALTKQFSKKLENLWNRRTAKLRNIVIPKKAGKPLLFSKKARDIIRDELLEIASEILVKRDGHLAFLKVKRHRHLTAIKGHGLHNRAKNMIDWAKSKLKGPIVYTFWNGQKCLYVGKGQSWRRLKNYDRSIYLKDARTIEVFCITTRSNLGKAECLATHLFEPRDNRVKAAKTKWGKDCPICSKHDEMREELTNLFKIK